MTRALRERPRLTVLAAVSALALALAAGLVGAALAGDDFEDAARARAQLERSEARSAGLARQLSSSRAQSGRLDRALAAERRRARRLASALAGAERRERRLARALARARAER